MDAYRALARSREARADAAPPVLFDPDAPVLCRPETMTSAARNTAYAGRRLHGAVRMTLVRGAVAFDG